MHPCDHTSLFTIAKTWNQPKCPLTGVDKEDTCSQWRYIYTRKYYSAMKKNEIMPFAAKRKTDNPMWYCLYVEFKIWPKWTYLWNKQTQTENILVFAKGMGIREGMEQEVGVSRCELWYAEWVNSKVLLYSTGNYIQYPVINRNGKE